MLILGIESSCDETAASVAEDYTKIRSNVSYMAVLYRKSPLGGTVKTSCL